MAVLTVAVIVGITKQFKKWGTILLLNSESGFGNIRIALCET
jgi:hypothetical protein